MKSARTWYGPESAFSDSRQAALFTMAVAVFLLLPLLPSPAARSPEIKYSTLSERYGGFPFITHQIFDNRDDIDLLFVGSSMLWEGIDTPYVADQLQRSLRRPAKVLTFGTNWPNRDLVYTLLRDTLNRHRVKLVVLCMNEANSAPDGPHAAAPMFFVPGEADESLRSLPLQYRLRLYASNVLGAPRLWLASAHRIPSPPIQSTSLGAHRMKYGFGNGPFVLSAAAPRSFSPEELFLKHQQTKSRALRVAGNGLAPYQMHFSRLIAELLRAHGVAAVILHLPTYNSRKAQEVQELADWTLTFGAQSWLVGLPEAKLFAGIPDEDLRLLFHDELHLNANGSAFFTHVVTPTLVNLYEQINQSR